MQQSPEIVMEAAEKRDDRETANHGDKVSGFAAALGQEAHQKDAKRRTVGVTKMPRTIGMIRAFRTILA
jgi:hypothetical protein